MSDLHTYWNEMGVPDHNVSVINVDGTPSTGGEGETTLDLEYSGFMAPGADIILYEGATPSFPTTVNTFNKMVTDNVADVASTSWGLCDVNVPTSAITALAPILQQPVAQGI